MAVPRLTPAYWKRALATANAQSYILKEAHIL